MLTLIIRAHCTWQIDPSEKVRFSTLCAYQQLNIWIIHTKHICWLVMVSCIPWVHYATSQLLHGQMINSRPESSEDKCISVRHLYFLFGQSLFSLPSKLPLNICPYNGQSVYIGHVFVVQFCKHILYLLQGANQKYQFVLFPQDQINNQMCSIKERMNKS